MEIVFGWVIVALYLVLCRVTMGSDYAWLMASLMAWAECGELFGKEAVGAFGLAVALTVFVIGWSKKLVRWIHRRRSPPLLVRQRGTSAASWGR